MKRSTSTTFWAWTASIVVHLVVLITFGVAKFSQSTAQGKQQPISMAKVSRIKKLTDSPLPIPKPKVKKPPRNWLAKAHTGLFPTNQIFDPAKPGSQDLSSFSKVSLSQSVFSSADSAGLPRRIKFFDSFTDQHKVCYVVDCSGSMQGVFGQVRKKLKDSIAGLQPDQYFGLIFFGNNRLFEFGKGQLVRATKKAKSSACDFIDSTRPAGRTNAFKALQRAMQIRDKTSHGPAVIFFLTDGFELTTKDTDRFGQKIINLLNRFAPTTKINTIGFWPQKNDRKVLETMASQSGGEFVIVTDDS